MPFTYKLYVFLTQTDVVVLYLKVAHCPPPPRWPNSPLGGGDPPTQVGDYCPIACGNRRRPASVFCSSVRWWHGDGMPPLDRWRVAGDIFSGTPTAVTSKAKKKWGGFFFSFLESASRGGSLNSAVHYIYTTQLL